MVCDYWFSSVCSIAETGEMVVADQTGSRVAPFLYSAKHGKFFFFFLSFKADEIEI
jgi:hypothetical protein